MHFSVETFFMNLTSPLHVIFRITRGQYSKFSLANFYSVPTVSFDIIVNFVGFLRHLNFLVKYENFKLILMSYILITHLKI